MGLTKLAREPLEIRLLPDDGRGRAHVFRLSVAAQRAWLALAALAVLLLLAGLACAPAVVSSLLLTREYEVQLSRRAQRGERLQSLVDGLEQLRRRGALLAERLARIQEIYEIPEGSAGVAADAVRPLAAAGESIFDSTIAHGEGLAADLALDLERARARLECITRFEAGHGELARSIPTRSPLAGSGFVLTSLFGQRRNLATRELEAHAGLDLAAPIGTPILATAAGTVTFAGPVQAAAKSDWWRFGRVVAIRHGERFLTLYGHCDSVTVRRGQRVDAGQPIATVGESGWTSAPHLHYEIRLQRPGSGWRAADPLDYALALAENEGAPRRSARRSGEAVAAEAPALLPAFLR